MRGGRGGVRGKRTSKEGEGRGRVNMEENKKQNEGRDSEARERRGENKQRGKGGKERECEGRLIVLAFHDPGNDPFLRAEVSIWRKTCEL